MSSAISQSPKETFAHEKLSEVSREVSVVTRMLQYKRNMHGYREFGVSSASVWAATTRMSVP